MMGVKYRAILFDADGLVLAPKRFSEALQRDYGISWSKMEPFFKGPFLKCKLGQTDLKEELTKVIKDWGWPGSAKELMAYWFSVGSDVDKKIAELIYRLRADGIKCFLSTNNEKYRMQHLWETVGLNEMFDGLIVSSKIGHLKNESGFFEEAYNVLLLKTSDIKRSEVLVIDHAQENLDAAANCGFAIYQYEDSESLLKWLDQLPD